MKKKLLLVDDEPNIVMALEYAFKKQGFEVFIARDGSEAVESLKTWVPDLVLLDIMMPKMDGFELASHMKNEARFRNIPIIMIHQENMFINDHYIGLS